MAKRFESDDPLEMVGVFLPTAPEVDATGEMARTFVEEFALMGFPAQRILRLFQNPFYAGAHLIYRQRGEDYVRAVIGRVLKPGREGGSDA